MGILARVLNLESDSNLVLGLARLILLISRNCSLRRVGTVLSVLIAGKEGLRDQEGAAALLGSKLLYGVLRRRLVQLQVELVLVHVQKRANTGG